MHGILIMLTPSHQNKYFECQCAKVSIAVLPILDVKTRSYSTPESLQPTDRLQEFTCQQLKNSTCGDYRPVFTTQDQWTIVTYIMEVFRPLQYWTLWMLKRHTVTLHHILIVYNAMFNHMDGNIRAFGKNITDCNQSL